MGTKEIILASASPRRKKILNQLNLEFKVQPAAINEGQITASGPRALVKKIALSKARKVSEQFHNNEVLIIAADTVVVFEKKVLGKPENDLEAEQMLEMLSGKKHRVLTGLTLLDTGKNYATTIVDITLVYFRDIESSEINNYIKTGEPFDKAGAYGIQGLGGIFVEKIVGSYANVVGLPVHKLAEMFNDYEMAIL
ncbi:MAG: Maf family protein [Bacillota bacterium]